MPDTQQFMIRVSGSAYNTIKQDAAMFRTSQSALLNTVVKNYARMFITQKLKTAEYYEKEITKMMQQIKEIDHQTCISQNAIRLLSKKILNNKWDEKVIISELIDGKNKDNPRAAVKDKKYKREHFRFRLQNNVAKISILKKGYRLYNDDKESDEIFTPTARFFNALFESYAGLSDYNRHKLFYADIINRVKNYSKPDYEGYCPYIIATIITYGFDITQKWLLRPYRITKPLEYEYPCLLAYTSFESGGNELILVKIPLYRIKDIVNCDYKTGDARVSAEKMRHIEKFMNTKDNKLLDDYYDIHRVLFTEEGLKQIYKVKSFKPKYCARPINSRSKGLEYSRRKYASVRYYDCSLRQLVWYLHSFERKDFDIDISNIKKIEIPFFHFRTYLEKELKYADAILLKE